MPGVKVERVKQLELDDVRTELIKARIAAGYTQEAAADALEIEISKSKVHRMERGLVSMSPNELNGLLTLYGVTDQALISAMCETSEKAQKQRWLKVSADRKGRPSAGAIKRNRSAPTAEHSELLRDVNEYATAILGHICTLNEKALEDDREQVADAINAIMTAAARGQAIRRRLQEPRIDSPDA